MALTKRSENKIAYLEVKHYCLWRGLKKEVAGCDVVEANNPATGGKVMKYGYRFDTVTGHATRLVKYDTEKKFSKRYFGFKLWLAEGTETYVIDMPYTSQILRRFLHVAPNIDWTFPLSITVFKGKKKEGKGVETTGIWFHQFGETIKRYYSREEPHGMPEATYDNDLQQWDFKAQQRWLVERLKEVTIPDIEAAATRAPEVPDSGEFTAEPGTSDDGIPPTDWQVDDSDMPF
jgi:hypothetical protein